MKVFLITPYFFEPHRWMMSSVKMAENFSRTMEVVVLSGHKTKRGWEKTTWGKIFYAKDFFLKDPFNYGIMPLLWWHVFQIIKQEKPDIVLVNKHMFFTAFSVPLLRILQQKVIVSTDTFPGINWLPRSKKIGILVKIYFWLFGFLILKMAHSVVVFHSENIQVAKKLGLNAILIPNGIDERFLKKRKEVSSIKKKKGEIWITYVGRLESVKNIEDILFCAEKTTKKYPAIHWNIVGNTKGKESLMQQYASDSIQFWGHRTDVIDILFASDIFVLASISEGLPNALIEAMACECTCISSNVGGVPDLITHEQTGLLFPPKNRSKLVQMVEQVIKNKKLREALAKNAVKRIEKEYIWKILVKKYESFFVKLIKEGSKKNF